MLKIIRTFIIFCLLVLPVRAANYYVSPTGDDSKDGSTEDKAWRTIDNGDQTAVLIPGDTVNILPGTYFITASIQLTTDGTTELPIVYRQYGDGDAIIDGMWESNIALIIEGNNAIIDGLEIYDVKEHAVSLKADSCIIRECYIHYFDKDGIRLEGSENLVLKNVVTHGDDHGIENRDSGENNKIYGNTVFSCQKNGLELQAGVKTARIFNNIIVLNDKGIKAKVENICGFNNVWNNSTDYDDGIIDSAGGISADPMFTDTASGDFSLQSGSPAIDTALDLGYAFCGSAPDMGAIEYRELAELIISPVRDSLNADSTYQFGVTGLDNCGDTTDTGGITWSHTFVSGDIDADGLFTPDLIGTGTIIATSDINGTADTTELMEVVPGDPDSLYITPHADTIQVDETRQFTAHGFDANGNEISDLGTLSWLVLNGIGTIDNTGLFTPGKVGYGFIKATYAPGLYAYTDSIFVVTGDTAFIDVLPASDVVEVSTQHQYAAKAYDIDSNLIGDITPSVIWTTTDPGGSVTVDGLYTAGAGAGSYYVKAVYNTLSDSGEVEVTATSLSYVQIELEDGTVLNDTTFTTDNDTTVLYCRGYDIGDNPLGDYAVNWSFIEGDTIGTVEGEAKTSTTLTLSKPGTGKIEAFRNATEVDSTGTITCLPGEPVQFDINPNTAIITADSTLHFVATSLDADDNETSPLVVPNWSVLESIGDIDVDGLFIPGTAGIGYIVADGGGVVDTSGEITVNPGELNYIVVLPDDTTIELGGSVQFTASGYDAKDNLTDAGNLIWQILGHVGSIDSDGFYFADRPGVCSVQVKSDINAVTDVSNFLGVEALYVSGIALGNYSVYAGQNATALLAFRVENFLSEDKTLTDISTLDVSLGAGNQVELLTNLDSYHLYYDADNDSLLTGSDSLIASEDAGMQITTFSFSPVTIESGTGRTFIVGADLSAYPHDGDSLDLEISPGIDIVTGDGTQIDGPEKINSAGFNIIDGLISDQLGIVPTDNTYISPGDTVYNILTIDLPRNGYLGDTLNIFSVVNSGTAGESDVDSLILYQDDGNAAWGGSSEESRIGRLIYTGDRWLISGLSVPLDLQTTRFYLGAKLADYPANGATLAVIIPENGVEMTSHNDGPIDAATTPIDNIVIQTVEGLQIETVAVPSKNLVPGENTGPIVNFKLSHSYPDPKHLDSLRLTLYANDPDGATRTQLDSQIDSVAIYKNLDGDYQILGAADSLLASATVSDGEILFDINGLTLPVNGTVTGLTIVAWLSEDNCKNGNSINFGFEADGDIYIAETVDINGAFPLKNDADFTINAFPSSRVAVNSIDDDSFFGGQTDRLIFDFVLPADGYSTDRLSSFSLQNNGSINEAEVISSAKLWADTDGDGFTEDDVFLGMFAYAENIWTLDDLDKVINPGGQRFFVTVNIANIQFEAGTIQLAIPVGGVEYDSGTDGPDDNPVYTPDTYMVFPSDRITAISIPKSSLNVAPGDNQNNILTFALYNGYVDQDQTLKGIKLTNTSHTDSDIDYADYELGQVSMYFDSDKSRTFNGDSLVSVGHFSGGVLQLTGMNIDLSTESLSYFFILADLPLDLIDSDSLAVAVSGHSDFIFSQSVNINGDLPLTSGGGFLIVDGSVTDQYELKSLSPRTLRPGDTSITVFSFKPAFNGKLPDTLNSVTLTNLQDADTADIKTLELWLDNNDDGIWQSSDMMLASFNYQENDWIIDNLQFEVESDIAYLFVIADISSTASSDASIQFIIPVNGCQYLSGNDGPRDESLSDDGVFPISTSGLEITQTALNPTYSTGQAITVNVAATNRLGVSIDSLYAEVVNISNPSFVTLDSSDYWAVDLAPDESVDLAFYYTADVVGEVSWSLRAIIPGFSDTSAVVYTGTVSIQTSPDSASVSLISSIPTSVTKGQTNVFPLSLRIKHFDTLTTSASLRLDELTISVEDDNGNAQSAGDVFSRMVISSGYKNLAILEDVPAESDITFTFDEPMFIAPGEEKNISLRVDIDSLASAASFAVAVSGSGSVPITDNNTLQPVPPASGIVFPLKTASCRVDNPSQNMLVSYVPLLRENVNYGQHDVPLVLLRMRHPGDAGSSQIQLTNLSMAFLDSNESPLAVSDLIERIRLTRGPVVIAELSYFDAGASSVDLQLQAPLTLNPGERDSLVAGVWISPFTEYTGFGIEITDSTSFTVRDLGSGSLLQIESDTLLSLSPEVFPIVSGYTEFSQPALPPQVCMESVLPASIVAGRDSLALLELSIKYTADEGCSPLSLDEVQLGVLDTVGRALDPDRLFDRIGYQIDGSPIVYQSTISISGGYTVFEIDNDIILNPSDSISMRFVTDIEADAPYDHFVILMNGFEAVSFRDMTDTSQFTGFMLSFECGSQFPFETEMTRIFLPAGRPLFEHHDTPARIAYPGGDDIIVMNSTLTYLNETPQGDLSLSGISAELYQRSADGYTAVPIGQVFDAVRIEISNQSVYEDTLPDGDVIGATLPEPYIISNGSTQDLKLVCDIRSDVSPGNYVIRLADSTFMDIIDKNLLTTVYPILSGSGYPLTSAEISISEENLGTSYTNFPNPFKPALGEETTIGYVLPEDAYVDIEIYTITGESVRKITSGSFRSAGSHQEDKWNGMTAKGLDVVPGTYFCQIKARYISGGEETHRRKIAVVR